jgi:NodT family efflux transporter outer membrane factor (OMF) lipoprotein
MSTFPNRIEWLLVSALALSASACAAPDLGRRPQPEAAGTLHSEVSLAGTASSSDWPEDQWWQAYGDQRLDALVDEALAGSPDVAVAEARIRQAEGASLVAGAAGMPQVQGQGSAGFTKQSYNMGVPAQFVPRGWKSTGTLALSGRFDLDIWGRQRAALAAATSAEQAARIDAQQASLMIATNVVSSYFDLARLIERGKALDEALSARERLADLAEQRARAGLDNQSPVKQALAQLSQARGEASANAEQINTRRHALAALLGAGPDRGLSIEPGPISTLPETPLPQAAGIALAARRPDIVAARLRVEAANQNERAAEAAFLPDISLEGLVGLTSLGLSNLIDSGSTYGNAGGAVTLPIFQGGRLRGEFTQARGRYEEAVANYNGTLVGALQDVADAVSRRDAARVQEEAARDAAMQAAAGYDLALKRYRAGLGTFLEALVAQTTAIGAHQAAIDAHFRTLASEVSLTRALGGGFAASPIEKATANE